MTRGPLSTVAAVRGACAVGLAIGLAAPQAGAVDIALTPFSTSALTRPVDITHAGDSRLFVIEKEGFVRIVQSDGTVLGTPFLDIDALVGDAFNEQGLLGLAFHPNYASNGFFYVHYTNNAAASVVARYTVSGNPDIANPGSALILLTVVRTALNHNGGDLNFGPNDGYLYISLGDSGSGCDPAEAAQSGSELRGKILRIDVDSGSPYAIPPSNPFVGPDGILDEIWALGLRNPWRFSFDRSNGDMYIGDVGQVDIEEVDHQPAASTGGENYGWDCYEGTMFNTCGTGCNPAGHVLPVSEYAHTVSPLRCSITGGNVYRGSQFPGLTGHYFFSDYCSSDFWSLTDPGTWNLHSFGMPIPGFNATSFGENAAGEVFVADDASGFIYRIESLPDPPSCPPTPASCTSTTKSILKAKRPGDPNQNRLLWKWLNGPALGQGDFGNPISGGSAYRLCVYNGANSAVIDAALPGGSAWQTVSTTGYKFKNSATEPDGGAYKALLKGGDPGKSKILVKAKGGNLDLSALPLNEGSQLRVQLIRNDSPDCWEATFPVSAIDVDSATQLKAKIP